VRSAARERTRAAAQDALTTSVPRLLRLGAASRADALPAELLPCAAAHLLPLLLLPPERVRALEPPSHSAPSSDDLLSDFLAEVVVRATPPTAAQGKAAPRRWLPGPSARASVRAQGACGRLVAGDSPVDCRALVPACAGLAPFVVQALRTLAERCARFPTPCQWARALSGDRMCCCLLRAARQTAARAANACTLKATNACGPGRACDGCRRRLSGPCRGRASMPGCDDKHSTRACMLGADGGARAPCPCEVEPLLGEHATRCGAAGDDGEGCPHGGSPCDAPALAAEARLAAALGWLATLCGAFWELAVALVRGGALGAALALARRSVDACAAPKRERELRAALAACHMDGVLRAAGGHWPAVVCARPAAPLPTLAQACAAPLSCAGAARQAALQLDVPALAEPSSTASQRRLAAMAAAVARFEAEITPGIAANAPLQVSLDDLRLCSPALRPMGCWWSGCASHPPPAPPARAHTAAHTSKPRLAVHAQVRQPGRRIGGGPADAAVLRLQRRALLLGRVPEGGLARGPQGRVPAPASACLTAAVACRARPARWCAA